MKNLVFFFLFFLAGAVFSQESLYLEIKEKLFKEHPELQTTNKLIVVNVWSANDSKSREANISLNKAATVYNSAKLKGGLKGMIGVTICKDEGPGSNVILAKDNVTKTVSISGDHVPSMNNIIFDSQGNVIAQNITGDIYSEVQKLITR
jgi:hypothetical protein